MPGSDEDPTLSPSPGDDETPHGAEPTEEPVAGGPTGEEPQPGTDVPEREPGAEQWAQLPEWARKEIINSRRATRAMREQALAHGWRVDENGVWHPPEPSAPTRPAAPALPAQPQTETGLAPEREAYYARRFREAELADDPESARMKVAGEMSREIARQAADEALLRGLRVILPSTIRSTVEAYKSVFRADPQRGEAFKQAEAEFDQVIAEAHREAEASGRPLILTDDLMQYFRAVAIDRALPKVLAAAGSRKTAQSAAAKAAAGQFHTAPGSATPGTPTAPTTLSGDEDRILGSLARGSGVDADKLKKGYAARKGRGE
jgi:hypothetical protein